ncbi:UNVERIFIED_ORG: transcriptional regulator with XRE-family HTH domain [Arthrobacter sp. UYEF13]
MPKSRSLEPAGSHGQAFSEAIRGRISRKSVSGLALAAQIGKSQNYVATRLSDEMSFTADDIEAIAAALRVSLADLVREVFATENGTVQPG